MIRTYFDRNVFQDLYERRRGISTDNVERLRSAIRHGEVSVAVSMTTLEETLIMWPSRQQRAQAEFQFILDLVRLKTKGARIVKEAGDLLRDDINAYAAGVPPSEPYVSHDLSRLLRNLRSSRDDVAEFVREVREQKESLRESLDEQRRVQSPHFKWAPKSHQGFGAYWDEHAVAFAKDLADHVGMLAPVEARGAAGLLDLRSVRMAVGVNLSMIYSQLVENRAPQPSDSRDVHHATCASAADTFVTNDETLAERLRRIPSLPVEVIDLATMLGRIGRGPERG